MSEIKKVTVVGAGTMGLGIAHLLARHGHKVNLVDISEDLLTRALYAIEKNLKRQAKKGLFEESEIPEILSRISTGTDISVASDAEIAVEAVTERKQVKEEIFRRLDSECPEGAIIASNTSSMSITELAAFTGRPESVIGMHFFNPVPVMKLVEIVRGYATSDETHDIIRSLALNLGKTPVEVRDFPGFVSNRLLMPLINEAVFALMEGVAGKEDIDTVMKLGMAHPMGPLQLADFIGLDVCLDIMEVMHRGLGEDKYRPCPLLRKMVAAGHLGRKSGKGFFDYPAN